jgi:hypothetical protein
LHDGCQVCVVALFYSVTGCDHSLSISLTFLSLSFSGKTFRFQLFFLPAMTEIVDTSFTEIEEQSPSASKASHPVLDHFKTVDLFKQTSSCKLCG